MTVYEKNCGMDDALYTNVLSNLEVGRMCYRRNYSGYLKYIS